MAWHSAESLHQLGEQVIKAVVDAIASDMNQQLDAIGEVKRAEEPTPATTARGAGGDMPSVAEIKDWAGTEFGDLPRLFGGFGNGDPQGSEPARDAMWSIVGALDPTFKAKIKDQGGHLARVMPTGSKRWRPDMAGDPNITIADREGAIIRRLGYWRGTAADSFHDNFVVMIPGKAEMQRAVAASLAACIESEQRIRASANDDVWRIGEATIKLLDSMSHPCQGSAQDVAGGLTIFAALVSVLAVEGPVGAALAVVGVASTSANAVSSAAPGKKTIKITGKPKPATITGGSVLSVISSMRHTVQLVIGEISAQEQELRRVINDVSLNVGDDEMTIPEPSDASGPASHNVGTISREDATNDLQFSPS